LSDEAGEDVGYAVEIAGFVLGLGAVMSEDEGVGRIGLRGRGLLMP